VILLGQTEDSRISVRLIERIDHPTNDNGDEDDDDDICDPMKRVYVPI